MAETRLPRKLGPAPPPTSEAVSRLMKSNKSKDTIPELILRSALRKAGIVGYRLHWDKAPGRPDISFTRHKLAVFVHGCFWHRCPICRPPVPKAHRSYWERKFELNIERDRKMRNDLAADGWRTLVLWEHEIRNDLPQCVRRIEIALGRAGT